MSGHEESAYPDREEQKIGRLDESAEGVIEEGLGATHETRSSAAEELGTLVEEVPEEEEQKERRQRKKKASKPRGKEQGYSLINLGKHLDNQTNYLARLEQVLQKLRKLAKSSEVQSKLVKDINTSVKKMERQIINVQKAIQKGKTKKVDKPKTILSPSIFHVRHAFFAAFKLT